MTLSSNRILVLKSPQLGILDLGGEETKALVEADSAFLDSIFGEAKLVDSTALACDVLFVYAAFTAQGGILGSKRGLREIVRDSGAKIVIVAAENPSKFYIQAGRQKPYGRANLVLTLDRRGRAFGQFFTSLFVMMKRGIAMPDAWVQLSPQTQGPDLHDCPSAIFACELGPLTFG